MALQKMEFRTEVNRLLDLMIHSLYSHKDISLRELISNASDAIDKARYESLTRSDILEQAGEWKIRLTANRESKTFTVSDNGVGMTRDEVIQALGTIAHSGTKEFLQALQQKGLKDSPELIGQFGVGFYSSFMIADRVTVISRKAGSGDKTAVRWESSADGSYTVEDIVKETPGTDVILHLKQEEEAYLDEWRTKDIVRKYSDFIEYPIVMEVEIEEDSSLEKGKKIRTKKEEQLNSGKALWQRERPEISEQAYTEFYRHISHDFSEPLKVIHYKAEGTSEFTSLLYIPSHAPLDLFYKEFKIGPALYVKKVQIMDHCEELIPPYLRFIKGVIDSSDLPLNISREILQGNRQVAVIKNSVTKKVLDTLVEMKKNEPDKYLRFHSEFGRVLKEGLHYDYAKRESIAGLLLFSSTASGSGAMRTLDEYVAEMKEGQNEIYYLTGAVSHDIRRSPYLEAFSEKNIEVLFMTDEIDDFIFSGFAYKGKRFRSVLKGDIKLEGTDAGEKVRERFGNLIDFMKERLKDDIKDIRVSGRLKDSPCCLVGEEGDLDPRMEKLLKTMGQEVPHHKKTLEINPSHPVLETMNRILEKDRADPLLEEYIGLLFDQARLLSGSNARDPVSFAASVSRLMVRAAEKVSCAGETKNS